MGGLCMGSAVEARGGILGVRWMEGAVKGIGMSGCRW